MQPIEPRQPTIPIAHAHSQCQTLCLSNLPLRDRERWVNVATAMMEDAALPPIELIHVNGTYFVRDGHHRVSVAKMIGQQEIDAIVTTWVCTLAETPCAKHAKKEKWATFFLTKWLHFPYRANGCIY